MAASVSSLDKDLRKLRLDKYTPQAAGETRSWIESILGERLPGGDLLEALKDGVALCQLVNIAVGSPGVRYKKSGMPFVQMENISLFLRACKASPLNLQEHDVFLTVDLYESKDPAQVLQCLSAFSRAANSVNPSAFPSTLGPKKAGVMSPQATGAPCAPLRGRGFSNASNLSSSTIGVSSGYALASTKTEDPSSGRWSPTKRPAKNDSTSPAMINSWASREKEHVTLPAWNIAQYGYLGGASQGNLGISFGSRRQITNAGPQVSNLIDRGKSRREKEAKEEWQRQEREKEEEHRRKAEMEAEQEHVRMEEKIWQEQARRLREEELRKQQEEKRKWEEQERAWKLTEEQRRRAEEEAEARLDEERLRARSRSREPKLQGQFFSHHQDEQGTTSSDSKYSSRVRELEKELELARQREADYQARRQKPGERSSSKSRARSRSRPILPSRMDSWSKDEREVLRTPRHTSPEDREFKFSPVQEVLSPKSPRPLPDPMTAVPPSRLEVQRTGGGRPLPDPTTASQSKINIHHTGSRPLPEAPVAVTASAPQLPPRQISSPQPPLRKHPSPTSPSQPEFLTPRPQPAPPVNRTTRFHASNPVPLRPSLTPTYGGNLGFGTERVAEDRRHKDGQAKTQTEGWASKSLLEREMEMERQRQQEWEEAQKETALRARPTGGAVDGIGGGMGGRWDMGQWAGFTGGDNQNKGGQGIGAGRRQIVGPRPLPGQR